MSRAGYSDDLDNWSMIKWRGMVASSIRGKRGQQLLRELAEAMDAMPVKELIAHELKSEDGRVCALGAVGEKRGVDVGHLDYHDPESLSKAFNVAECLAQEIEYVNDECGVGKEEDGKWRRENPAERWQRVRKWVDENLKPSHGDSR